MSSAALPEHCYYCFEVLHAELNRQDGQSQDKTPVDFEGSKEYPLFVTWNIYSSTSAVSKKSSEPRLRGCIGTFSPLPLKEGLKDYAITAALHDSRFSSISKRELPRLECGVSLLTHFEDCSDPYDWQIGKHGIYLSFSSSASSQRNYTATYLPDVIPAQNWTQDEALASAMRKSGYQGPIDAEFIKSKVKVRRYQSEKVERTVEEWRAWKEEQRGED